MWSIKRCISLGLLAGALAVPVEQASAAPASVQVRPAHWSLCRYHLDWQTATRVVAVDCHRYPMRRHHEHVIGHWTSVRQVSPHVRVRIRYPEFAGEKKQQPGPTPTPIGRSYTAQMLVTFYTDVGPMADGVYTYSGAAACGYDLPTLTRVFVPGVGLLVCHDRIGYQPYRHIDVWMPSVAAGEAAGLGSDERAVTVYLP